MNQTVAETPAPTAALQDPQRLAWGVLLMAFALFCVLCVAVGVGVNYFLFQSSVPMQTMLVVGRGSAGLVEPANERFVPDRAWVSNNTRVSTAPPSQATIFFFDNKFGDQLIANVTLRDNSSIAVRSALMPRFEWSTTDYVINLYDAAGQFDITISAGIERNVVMSLQTDAERDVRINLTNAGHYTVNISESRVRVYNRDGRAYLIPDGVVGYSVATGEQGVINLGDRTVERLPGYINLLDNSDFEALGENVGGGMTQGLIGGWVCGNGPNDDPPGTYRAQPDEGRMTLRLERYQQAIAHGWTFCSQTFGTNALDITALNLQYLGLRATFYVHHQSLDACGFQGSECPLMVRVDYINQRGEPHKWFHGFYSKYDDPQSSFPLICSGGCSQEHEFVKPHAWYTYDSGNLLTLFAADEQISSIIGVWFYASGHEYDVQVSEMALIGQYARPGVELIENPEETETPE